VIKAYKPLTSDSDAVSRAKAQAQLAKLVPPIEAPKGAPVKPPVPVPPPATAPEGEDASLEKAVEDAKTALADAKSSAAQVEEGAKEIAAMVKIPTSDLKKVEELAAKTEEAAKAVSEAAGRAEEAAKKAEAGAAKSAAEARAAADEAKGLIAAAKKKSDAAADEAKLFGETDPRPYIRDAQMKLDKGDISAAESELKSAKAILERTKKSADELEYTYAQIYERRAESKSGKARRDLLDKAKKSYEKFAASSTGGTADKAKIRAGELDEEIKELDEEAAAATPPP
jgi:colicin import membrane protein